MSDDRIRVTFTIDPLTERVYRAGIPLDLSPETQVRDYQGRSVTLGEIMQVYSDAITFDDVADRLTPDVQEAVGLLLHGALGLDEEPGRGGGRWVEIAVEPSADGTPPDLKAAAERRAGFLRRLPWPFTYDPSLNCFLAEREWVFTIASGRPEHSLDDQIFPPEPKILLMLPHRLGFTKQSDRAQVTKHRAEIRQLLRDCYSEEAFAANVREVRSWPQAYAVLQPGSAFDPDIIYFFGHGVVDQATSHLQFDAEGDAFTLVSAMQIAVTLTALPATRRPALFFANCCSGAAARTSFGDKIEGLAGCVIANRTVVDLTVASAFGSSVLAGVVARMEAPPDFMGQVTLQVIAETTSSTLGGRWACPVVHTNYGRWIPLRPGSNRRPRGAAAGRIFERLDRAEPVGTAVSALRMLLGEERCRLRALIWQSESAQGSAALGPRLRDELMLRFTTLALRDVVVELQHDALTKGNGNFRRQIFESLYVALATARDRHAMTEVFGAGKQMYDVLKLLDRHLAEKNVVLLVRTHPLPVGSALGQQLVRDYWDTWLDLSAELSRDRSKEATLRILLAVGLEISPMAPPVETSLLLQLDFEDPAAVIDLGVLSSVLLEDIIAHLAEYASVYGDLSRRQHCGKAAEIHAATHGVFMPTIQTLKSLADQT